MQDNDPKHTSKKAQEWFVDNGINWWKTPAESPDVNPIENVWHELKEFLRREVKPKIKVELVSLNIYQLPNHTSTAGPITSSQYQMPHTTHTTAFW